MAKSRRSKRSSRDKDAVIDFTKAKEPEGGGRVRLPEDDYHVRILGGKYVVSSDKETPGIAMVFQIREGKKKGKKVTERFWLSPKALPRLRNLLETVGVKPPKKVKASSIIKAVKGKELGITLQDEEYDNRIQSRVAYDFMTVDELNDDADSDDTSDDSLESSSSDDSDDTSEESSSEDESSEDSESSSEDESSSEEESTEESSSSEEPRKKKRSKSKSKGKSKSKKKKSKKDDTSDDLEELDLDEL